MALLDQQQALQATHTCRMEQQHTGALPQGRQGPTGMVQPMVALLVLPMAVPLVRRLAAPRVLTLVQQPWQQGTGPGLQTPSN